MKDAERCFQSIFSTFQEPVIVCARAEGMPVVFANASARLLIDPMLTTESLKENAVESTPLADMIRFQNPDRYNNLLSVLESVGYVESYRAHLLNHEERPIPVIITCNLVRQEEGQFFVIYLRQTEDLELSAQDINTAMTAAFQIANQTKDVDDAINKVLGYAGGMVQVSRVYIFEEISPEDTANTYEWCAPGVEPAIQDLQNLKKEEYNYDVIINSGMYITDDIRELPENDREILAAQGIKALAILPLFDVDRPLGYIGFDDCVAYRRWSSGEIGLLKTIANVVVSLLVRRNAQRELSRSQEVLQVITDNIENIIYVSDIRTNELVFLNKTMADALGRPAEEMIGKPCWQVLQNGMEDLCPFCPVPRMLSEDYNAENKKVLTWEFENTITHKWYLVKDSIIKWIDGREVHMETAVEITHQKQYEERLKHYASTDMMTGAYNREWGYKIMKDMLEEPGDEEISLVFIDIDALKLVNDTYGHDAGDDMILTIMDTIHATTRRSDALCRWGGDEFILLLRCERAIAIRITENIQRKLDVINNSGQKPYRLSFSYGVTNLRDAAHATIDAAIMVADKLMYEHKTGKAKG